MTAGNYITAGQAVAPGNNGAVYNHATNLINADAPAGYNFDNPLHDGNSIVYTSDDGMSYSVDGVVTSVADYTGNVEYFGA